MAVEDEFDATRAPSLSQIANDGRGIQLVTSNNRGGLDALLEFRREGGITFLARFRKTFRCGPHRDPGHGATRRVFIVVIEDVQSRFVLQQSRGAEPGNQQEAAGSGASVYP